jgi:hypothetical protein
MAWRLLDQNQLVRSKSANLFETVPLERARSQFGAATIRPCLLPTETTRSRL